MNFQPVHKRHPVSRISSTLSLVMPMYLLALNATSSPKQHHHALKQH